MKLRFNFLFYLLGAGVLLVGCSTRKDTFVNRNWHALNTKYNVLYNGNLAFEEGREQLNETYRDNYWEILPVERLEVSGEIKLDSEDNNPNFLKAEEKAAKAIQKHSMDISDQERNPQTDEAFLLLGKARYFDERYIPALEAFNYVLRKYEESDKLNEATIWREKTNIRLGYEELAIKNLKRLFKFERLKDQEYADSRAIMGQAYINLNAPDTAIQELKIAAAYTRKPAERGRYLFIIGQLFNQLGHRDSANIAFDKIIALNRKVPRVYLINAHLRKIQNTPLDEENREALLEYLTELEEDRENRPFLDIIFRQLAVHHRQTESDSLALSYYNQSLRKTQLKPQLNALNYQDLADYYFDENSYRTAGAYYDSVLLNLDENTRTFRAIRKKRDNLDDVINYEEVVQYTDSVIRIYYMSPVQREIYYQNHIDSLKAIAEAEALKKEQQANSGFAAFAESKGGKQNKGKFYFYNITSLGYGKTAFTNKRGNRELEDNWRWSNKARILSEQETLAASEEGVEPGELSDEQRYSLDFYLEQIPKDPLIIDSLERERNFANYQLGLIYKEKFKELMLAAGKLESVLASDPEERPLAQTSPLQQQILPSKYNLLKIYEAVDSPLWESMRSDIIQNHPDSRYAALLMNPEIELSALANSPESRYAELFRKFREQRFLEVITGAEKSINQFTGDPIVPKLELLKANAIGRLQGFIDFKEALNYVALNYPNSAEGKQAQTMIDEQIPQLENKEFSTATGSEGRENWKVVFPFKRYQVEEAESLVEKLEKSLKDLNYKNRVSRDIYDLEDAYVVVHGFPSRDFALGYLELLKNNKDYLIERENFVILSSNYKIIQVHKNIDDYRNTIQSPKP